MLRSALAVSQQWTAPSLNQEGPSKSGFLEAIRIISKICTENEQIKEEKKFLWIFILVRMRKLHKKLGLEGNSVYL